MTVVPVPEGQCRPANPVDLFRFPEEIAPLGTTCAVGEALVRAIAPFGMTTYSVTTFPAPKQAAPSRFLVSNWTGDWLDTYFDRAFIKHDPRTRAVALSGKPVSVADIRAGRCGFIPSEREIEVLDMAAERGRPHGLVVPVHGAQGYRGIVFLLGPGPDPGPRERAILQFLAMHAHDRMRSLSTSGEPGAMPALTPREIEVLTLARRGLGDDAIAQATDIAIRTVRFHFVNARNKLQARTRAEAIATAINLNLLPP